jgi:hypothetical protein
MRLELGRRWAGCALLLVASFAASRTLAVLLRILPAACVLGAFAFAINAVAQAGPPLFPVVAVVAVDDRRRARGAHRRPSRADGTRRGLAGDGHLAIGGRGRALGLFGARVRPHRRGARSGRDGGAAFRAARRGGGPPPRARRVPARRSPPGAVGRARRSRCPLVLSSVRRADRLAYVLAARHWGAARRTPPGAPHADVARLVVLALSATLASAALWFRV